jgi:hypothetical protein
VADPGSGSIRAYERGALRFQSSADGVLLDDRGRAWRLTEEELVATSEGGQAQRLRRLPGHVALWFGWYGFYPDTEVWGD